MGRAAATELRRGQGRPLLTAVAGRWALAVAIAGSALAVGTVHTITLCIVTAVLAVAAVLAWWGAEPMRVRTPATVLLYTGIVLTAFTVLQCVPMPIGWLAVIAPHNADVWSRALAPLHEPGPSWAPISLDPIATRIEALKGVAYLLAFVTALRIARAGEGVVFLSAVVVGTGLCLALAALLHPAFGAKRLFGVYEPSVGVADRHVAPLMNPNNLAGYLNLALCLSLAVTIAPQPRIPRHIAGATTLLLIATQLWVASRAGVVAMVLGAIVVIILAPLQRSRDAKKARSLAIATGASMVAGAALIVLGGSEQASVELWDANVSKYKLFEAAMRMVPAAPFLGFGRGSFESAFPAFRSDPGYFTYTHPENFLAQWSVEWGIPVGVAGLAAIAIALRPNVVLARPSIAGGAWAGLAALSVQNLGDLGTEIPGVMLAAVTCAAMIVGGTSGSQSRWRLLAHWSRSSQRVAVSCAFAASAALALSLPILNRELHEERTKLRTATLDRAVSSSSLHAMVRAGMLDHPAEPYLPFVVSLRAAQTRGENPIPWIGATLDRARVYAPAHLVLARLIAARSPSQARLEYRLAIEQAPETPPLLDEVIADIPMVVRGYFDALEVLPDGKEGPEVKELLVQRIRDRLPATSTRLDQLPTSPAFSRGPELRLATDCVADLEARDSAPWCQGAGREWCVRHALDESVKIEQLEPQDCEGYALHSRARVAAGDVAGGLTELAQATDRVTDRVLCLEQLVVIARRAGDGSRADAALDKIVTAACGAAECSRNLIWAGQQYEATDGPHKALALYRRAFEQAPDEALLEHMAELAGAGALHAEAAQYYDQLARKHPDDPRWTRLAAAQHEAMVREAELR